MTDKPTALTPLALPQRPIRPLPPGAVDTHVHLVGHNAEFPLWSERVEDPAPGALAQWIERFKRHQACLGLQRTVIVHSILYGGDNRITLAATKALGTQNAKAICLVEDGAAESELDRLAEAGAVGIRLNYIHGGILSWEGARALAPALRERGMHIQMLANAGRDLPEIAQDIRQLDVPVVFDHLAWPQLDLGVNDPGFQTLCALVGDGHAYVKLSGAYRVCAPPYSAAEDHLRALINANPERVLWGTDWPHLMLADARLPDAGVLLNQLLRLVGDDETDRIFVDNPSRLYGFSQAA